MKKRLEPAPRDVSAPVEPTGAPDARAPEGSSAPPAAAVAGVRRKKAPDQVRAQLLAAASEIATHHGVAALTLDAVAERAGVTKGALQYHFANKQGLLDALFGQATERFGAQMAARMATDSGGDGAAARAYLHAVLDAANPAASTDVLRVLVASMITEQDTRALVGADARMDAARPGAARAGRDADDLPARGRRVVDFRTARQHRDIGRIARGNRPAARCDEPGRVSEVMRGTGSMSSGEILSRDGGFDVPRVSRS